MLFENPLMGFRESNLDDFRQWVLSVGENSLTSAAIKAKVFRPPKKPTQMQIMNMKPDSVRIEDSRPTRRMCDQPGVVGEKDS